MISQNALLTNTDITLLSCLKESIRNSKKIKILAAFIMESGVRLILDDLIYAQNKGAQIQILTGYYLGITEPSALYLLKMNLDASADMRIFKHRDVSFHPKTYIFQDEEQGEIYIGSSNISLSALKSGMEWNYKIVKHNEEEDFTDFVDHFNMLFEDHSFKLDDEALKNYSIGWKRNRLFNDNGDVNFNEKYNPGGAVVDETTAAYKTVEQIKPYGVQIEALYHLGKTREEGMDRGLVVMATGVGKTYLAAFDSMKHKKILFVAHREEILNQAYKSFMKVMPERSFGFFKSPITQNKADVIFASVQTLCKEDYLNEKWFKPDYFDYIIIDEFHHVAANSYKGIVDYFKPKFLLGLTATPFRMDNKDIFEFCDDNLVYEINLKEAIEREYLVPFKYYGIYDDTDYSKINFSNGKYNEKELEKALSVVKRAELVLKYYKMFALKKTLAFCCSINHANFMAKEFNRFGLKAVAVHSGDGEYTEERDKAIERLKLGALDIIFVVDIFNEGVDIPEIDSILFLRPTESYTIFIQQLGRGLRKYIGKAQVTVLDFIGNFRRAHILPILLSGRNPMAMTRNEKSIIEMDYPEGCNVQFDMKLIDLFEQLKRNEKLSTRIENEYFRLRGQLDHRPTRTDIFEGSDIKASEFFKLRTGHQVSKGYLALLSHLGELQEEETGWIGTEAENFLYEIETMSMSKLYKIPTIRAFIKGDKLLKKVSANDIAVGMKAFYQNPRHSIDMQDPSSEDYLTWSIEQYQKLAIKMPINFINKSSDYFNYDEINRELYISEDIHKIASPLFIRHIEDILEYKLRDKCAKLYKKLE